MESAIRSALDRAGIPGAEARGRIYQSARTALERSLERQGIDDAGIKSDQKAKLEALIAGIEAEWAPPGTPGSMADQPVPQPAAPVQAAPIVATSRPAAPVEFPSAPTRSAPDQSAGASPFDQQPAPAVETRRPEVAGEPRHAAPPVSNAPARAGDGRDGRLDVAPAAGERSQARAASPVAPETRTVPAKQKKVRVPKEPAKRRKRPVYSAIFSGAVMLSFIGIGIWFAAESGAFKSAAERDTGVPNPPPSVSEEDFAGNGGALRQLEPGSGFSGEWTSVYSPTDGAAVSTRGSAAAEVVTDGDAPALRITSRAGDQNGEVLVPLGADVLQTLAGHKSVLALTVRSATNDASQIYVKCEFSTLGDCGRRRFDVTYETTDILLNLDYDRALAPNSPGHLIINSDISGGGKSIDLLAIRMRPGG